MLIQDLHPDTFFNLIWISGPHIFSFAQDSTVVRSETYAVELHPGYHANRAGHLESALVPYFQGFWKHEPKTEQDDTEWEVMRGEARVDAASYNRRVGLALDASAARDVATQVPWAVSGDDPRGSLLKTKVYLSEGSCDNLGGSY